MPQIGTVTSAGKTVLSLLDIDNQIKSGNTLGARSSVDWLRNEISKMKLGEANKKITKLNSDLAKAISERKTADEKLSAAKFDHLKAQTEQEYEDFKAQETQKRTHDKALMDEKYKNFTTQQTQQRAHDKALMEQTRAHDKALMNEQVSNLQEVTDLEIKHFKNTYENRYKDQQNAQMIKEIERIQGKIDKGEELLPFEKQFIRQAVPKASGMDPKLFLEGIESSQNNTLLDTWMFPLEVRKQNQTITPQEDMRLFIMRMVRTGNADKIDPATISRMFDETITEAQLNKMKAQAEHARTQRRGATAAPAASAPTATPKYAPDLPGVPAPTAPAPTAQPTPEQQAEAAAWQAVESQTVQDVTDLEMNQTPAGRNVYNKRQEALLKQQEITAEERKRESEAAQNVMKSLPEGLAAIEYFRRQTAAEPTDANKALLNQVVNNFMTAPYMSSEYASAIQFLENKAAQAGTDQDKKFWTGLLAQVSKEGVPKPTSTSAKSTKKAAGSALNRYGAEIGTWREAMQKGTHKTGTPEEARSTYNANSVIASLGQTLPKSFTTDRGFFSADRHVGGINWGDGKDALKMRQFTGKFLNQLTADLRAKGYTPADVQSIIEDIEGGVGAYGAVGGRQIMTKGEITGVDALFQTFANIQANPATKRILTDFKKQLTIFAAQQGTKEAMAAEMELSDDQLRLGLWKATDGSDFDAWLGEKSSDASTKETSTTKPEGTTTTDSDKRRWFNPRTKQFEDIDKVVRDTTGNIREIIVDGKRRKLIGKTFPLSENVPLPPGIPIFRSLPKGTPLVVDGQMYHFEDLVVKVGGTQVEVLDSEGNIRTFDYKKQFQFPSTLPTWKINQLLRGVAGSGRGAKQHIEASKRQKKPANPFTPNVSQPSRVQKKNKGAVASTLTWETLRGGGRVVRLDPEGRSFASILNLRRAGQSAPKGTSLSGFYDADTGYGINVELPDWNKDGKPDDMLHLEGGKIVALPEIWKQEQYDKGDGAVYSKDTTIRLAGFQAEEIYLTPEDRKQGRMNPAAVRAQQALIQIFQQGWVDAKEKNRFIFKVRVVGAPNRHSQFTNPYRDKYDRIITDVYIASGGTDKKIGEIKWVNPTKQLERQGHGRPWRRR